MAASASGRSGDDARVNARAPEPRSGSHTARFMYTLALLWLLGAALRITVLAIPPVIPPLQHDLGLSQTGIGILSSLPLLLFACAAIPGAALVARFGVLPTLIGGLLATALASALRALSPGVLVLFGTSLAMGAGIAVMQPAVPPLVRDWVPRHIGVATAVYSNGMLGSEAISAALTIPFVLPWMGGSWRLSLVFWSLPVVLAAILVALHGNAQAIGTHASKPASAGHRWWPDWKDPLTWQIGLAMGCGSSIFFGVNAFLPGFLIAAGHGQLVTAALAALNGGQIPATIILLFCGQRVATRRATYAGAGAIVTLGIVGLLTMPGAWVLVWCAVIGFCAAWIITLGLMLPPLLAAPADIHRMAGALFTIGYLVAVVMPIVGGAAWDATGVRDAAFVPFAACGVAIVVLGAMLRFVVRQPEARGHGHRAGASQRP